MRLLHIMDSDDYENCTRLNVRHSARAIIISDGKIAMIHSQENNYYKFPGGGIKHGESKEDALIRETLEETGLHVIPESIEELGYIHRIRKSLKHEDECFIQIFVDPRIAFNENAKICENDAVYGMAYRENLVLQLLIDVLDQNQE